MTDPELEALREKLIEGVVETIDKIFDEILVPTELEPRKKVRWGKTDPAVYGRPTTHIVTEREALAHADQRIIEGYAPPLVFELDDDDRDLNEGRYERQD